MKANKIEHGNRKARIVLLAVLVALGVGVAIGYRELRKLYVERCELRDIPAQVEIVAGKMVRPGTVAEVFGLKRGTNLADIDFARKRAEALRTIPNLREIRITRHLPDRITIVTEERSPVAKMGFVGSKAVTGHVVDTEGMVFDCMRGTQTLPTIREAQKPGTPKGSRIAGRVLAALKLIEACREPDFSELGVLEVDTSKKDFLVVTLSNYSRVKICWNEMDESTPASRRDLTERLTLLRNAIRSRISPETVIWNATIPDRIFADTQGKL